MAFVKLFQHLGFVFSRLMNSKSSSVETTLSKGESTRMLEGPTVCTKTRANNHFHTHRIDVQGMMSVMRYSGGFHPSQPIIQWLWEVVDEMTPEQQRKFLRFMTSCSRQPLLGFNSLTPAPCIQQTRLREDDYGNDVSDESAVGNIRLPTSATCMNLLKLPKYPNKEMLKEKLLYAIECAAGFELS
jgi:hypothetical protein